MMIYEKSQKLNFYDYQEFKVQEFLITVNVRIIITIIIITMILLTESTPQAIFLKSYSAQ